MKILKRIVVILLLSVTAIGYSQPLTYQARRKNKVRTLILFTTAVTLNAIGDGLNDSGHKPVGHVCNAVAIGGLLMSPYFLDVDKSTWVHYLASYVSIRVALFDPIYNETRGLPFDYIGTTSLTDKGLRKLGPQRGLVMFTRSVFLVVGVSIPLNNLY